MNLISSLLRKNTSPARVAGFILSNFIGLAIIVGGLQFYQDARSLWTADDSFVSTDSEKMVDARRRANKIESEREKAIAYHDTVVPCMDTIRYHIDKLELMVDNQMWPLPKYRELLFIR